MFMTEWPNVLDDKQDTILTLNLGEWSRRSSLKSSIIQEMDGYVNNFDLALQMNKI